MILEKGVPFLADCVMSPVLPICLDENIDTQEDFMSESCHGNPL